MSYSYDPLSGHFTDHTVPESDEPNSVRCLYDNCGPLYDAGVNAGMGSARDHDRPMYDAYLKIYNGIYGVNPVSKAYAKGFIDGYCAITSGAMC